MRRVVITGIGAVTPLGNDAAATWSALAAGRSGIGALTTFDASGFPVRIAGLVRGFDPARDLPATTRWRHLSRAGQFGVAAAAQAIAQAGLDTSAPDGGRGVAMGASVGRPDLQLLVDVGHERATTGKADAFRRQPPSLTLQGNQNLPTAEMARLLGASGPMVGISTACSGSGHAVGEAFRLIQEGDADLMLAGGYDSLTTWLDALGFSLLGALTTEYNDDPEHASRPFDARRSGFVLGEGAVAFILEEREAALARGATVLAEIRGYASTLNAWRITDSPPDGTGAIQVMEGAIAESGLGVEGIDYVVAHGTSTPGNDESETVAIKQVFGEHAARVMVSAPKSMAGHLTAAGAGLNMVAAIGAIRHGVVPPTLNLDTPGRGLDLDYVPHTARTAPVRGALVNAFAFGGTNTGLVLGAAS
ncbi:beta-ketoacyl-[acyl-carrier-protein] synthase family protein [Nocardia cyriacigeorgica]|uniref:beta-ketoacyl-[acyl-carrier-protein] synthase family protein n=1 Tax=Nocardia cyriacigeorgica TaxID=135487 RepID=UPI0018962CC1|nr:beta-ketoacyl-[acyl-carrier-protein] synthase family protein [Nocardia cyriacigeorgica]MBF6101695.1 beta-ketoacyl-[acyl-carrier-protein] synthase family protein [Nocardia cyriacigeorgica]MBF6158954.1 beta-ketoacyl-[acyl-carrier-protein] synthase family protein [Nocardia cyriacigeorgica]MBF6197360.1 beta-ketoacyl-[acyl-carrier-protein] synthase family protein [Nocardia cyriacigeorgica]MBF6319034.1 beta-ketoacyl-[acyl-carrier-protein] synthase family protein [Nocardia cyriacigeorgica]MBF65136